jgi:hypothetical protein
MTESKAIRPGTRLFSANSTVELVVVAAPGGGLSLTCGGVPMTPDRPSADEIVTADAEAPGPQMGKRYWDADTGFEVLCTKPGSGELALDGNPLAVKSTRALPSSD